MLFGRLKRMDAPQILPGREWGCQGTNYVLLGTAMRTVLGDKAAT